MRKIFFGSGLNMTAGSVADHRLRAETAQRGFSLVELLVTTAIFSILLAGVFGAYFSQLKHSTTEYTKAESEIELTIAKRILEQDLMMAGYGLADDYGTTTYDPRAIVFRDSQGGGGSDEVLLNGTALGMANRASQGWSYVDTVSPTPPHLVPWGDPREHIENGDRIILMDPSIKRLVSDATGKWLLQYVDSGATNIVVAGGAAYSGVIDRNTLAYGLYSSSGSGKDGTARPYHTVRYYLGGTSPKNCSAGTFSLERVESVERDLPASPQDQVTPLLSCVLDMQVGFGLDTTDSGDIDTLTDTQTTITNLSREQMNDQLKRIKMYLLVQSGNRDSDYTYPLDKVWVGEGPIGREITLTDEQRKYHWRLVSLSVQPRNVR